MYTNKKNTKSFDTKGTLAKMFNNALRNIAQIKYSQYLSSIGHKNTIEVGVDLHFITKSGYFVI